MVKNPPAEAGDAVQSLGCRMILWNRKWHLAPVFLPREAMDREASWATVHRVAKRQTRLSTRVHMIPWLGPKGAWGCTFVLMREHLGQRLGQV